MKLLLDTHVLVWTVGQMASEPGHAMSVATRALLEDDANELYFSSVGVWEVAIKSARGKPAFRIDPHLFRRALLESGYVELVITSEHAAAVASLPPIHQDPFDRMLIAQATVEGMLLLTNDEMIVRYPGPIRRA